MTDSLHLPALRTLPKDFLYVTETYTENLGQLTEAPMTLRMRRKYLATQIILIGSRHIVFVAGVSPSLHYTIPAVALLVKCIKVAVTWFFADLFQSTRDISSSLVEVLGTFVT